MVKAINKVIVSIIRYFKWLIIAMTIISALGTSMMIWLGYSYDSFKASSYNYLETYGYPDVTINTNALTDLHIDELQKIDGVDKICKRITFQSGLKTQDESSLSAKYYCLTNDEIESFYFYEKDDSIDGIYLEKEFANNNNIAIGNTISVKIESLGSFDVKVSALVTSPECLNNKQTSGTWGDNYRLGTAFIPYSVWANEISDYDLPIYNQVLFRSKSEENNDAILKAATTIIGESNISSSYTFQTSNAKNTIDINLAPLKALSIFLPLCFYAGALLVSCVFLLQMVRQYRKQLGILTAIGYTKGQLILIVSLLSLLITLVSAILAVAIGALLANLSFSLFLNSVHIPVGVCRLTISSTILACLISIVISQIAALISTIVMFKISPSEIINQAPDPAQTKQNRLLNKITSKVSAYTKINILTIFRSNKDYLFHPYA